MLRDIVRVRDDTIVDLRPNTVSVSTPRFDRGAHVSPPTPHAARRRRRWALPAVAVVSLLAIGVLLVLVVRNGDRAEAWQRRSERQDISIAELHRVLDARSSELNRRTRQVNKLTASVRRSQTALQRSESDVSSLAARQRALANEKAQVEDERAQLNLEADALAGVAASYQTCSEGLIDLLTAYADEAFTYASTIVDGVASDCQNADDGLSAYQSRYG